jgi:hypothetical protein
VSGTGPPEDATTHTRDMLAIVKILLALTTEIMTFRVLLSSTLRDEQPPSEDLEWFSDGGQRIERMVDEISKLLAALGGRR